MSLSPRNKQHTMEALANLSKFQGRYDVWLQIRQRYNLKWSSGNESLQALERFFNPEMGLDQMIDKVKQMMQVLPPVMSSIVKYAVLTGLRPSEAIESVKLLNRLPVNDCSPNTSNNYYDPEQQTLRHYLFPDTFLRATKKAYLSYVTPEILHPVANLGYQSPTWNTIRLACKHRKIDMEMRLCRKIFASHLRNSGIQPEVVDMLQGRVPPSVLTRHYLVPDRHFKEDVLKALKQLEQRL
jgi:intergrase/recombinase